MTTPCDTYTLSLGDIYVRCQSGGTGILPKISLCFEWSLDYIWCHKKLYFESNKNGFSTQYASIAIFELDFLFFP